MATDIFLTNNASDLDSGSNTDYEAWTARGGAAVSEAETAAQNFTPFADVNGEIFWQTKRLEAVTLAANSITANLRMAESAMATNAQACITIEEIDNTGALVGTIVDNSPKGVELGTSEAAQNWVAGSASYDITAGNRIRIRPAHRGSGIIGAGTVTFWFDGPTGAASGDSWVQFAATLTEYVAPAAPALDDDMAPLQILVVDDAA